MHSIFRDDFKRWLILNDIDNTPEESKFVGGRFAIPLNDVADVSEDEGVHLGGVLNFCLFQYFNKLTNNPHFRTIFFRNNYVFKWLGIPLFLKSL